MNLKSRVIAINMASFSRYIFNFGYEAVDVKTKRRRLQPLTTFTVVMALIFGYTLSSAAASAELFAGHLDDGSLPSSPSSSAVYAQNDYSFGGNGNNGGRGTGAAAASPQTSKSSSGCPASADSQCLRCNIEGCIKCPSLLVTDTRRCVETCPSGYTDQWSSHPDYMGRVCIPSGISGPLMAAIAGLLAGFFVCFTLLLVAVYLIRQKRRRKTIKQKLINENTMDRADFLRQLNDMRPNAEYFLAMLNDTRRQIRKLYLSGEVAAANSYRPIVRDLAKILILLNRPMELIPAPPHDWGRIYTWSEQALERYKPQVGQLIDFFQAPHTNDRFDSPYKQTTFKTQLPNGHNSSSSPQKVHLFGSLISLHEFDEPRPSDPFGSSFNTLKSNLISDLNTSSIWLEDEFFKLGFRPQDEITTEL